VKPNRGGGKRDQKRTIEPGRIAYTDITLGDLMMLAYGVKRYQLSGPDWIVSGTSAVSYDVVATAGKAVPPAEIQRMIGPLLAERFHLQFHRETRELPIFALVQAKGGPKFKEPGDGAGKTIRPTSEGGLSFKNWTMEDLADWLSILPGVGLPVIDRTGMTGSFSFQANLFAVEKGADPGQIKKAMIDGDAAGTLRSTLPDQLGLRLEGQKAPLEMLVIDHADRVPVEN
jgi:uncharacterized protein (TIGR03435 family)